MKIVLLGGDLNAYSVAVSFHLAYGVKSAVFCRYRCGITAYSSIVELHIEPNITEDAVGCALLLHYARGCAERPYLIPCGDAFVSFAVRNRERLAAAYRFLLPPSDLYFSVRDKGRFYKMLAEAGLPHPKTVLLERGSLSLSSFLEIEPYPAVLKPSDSVEYYAHPFEGMCKVYFPETPRAALEISQKIFRAGYKGRLVLQKRIGSPSDPPTAQTLTLLCDSEGKVRRGVHGEVLVEESASGAIGNYAAILSRPPNALTCRLVSFLEQKGYTGIANFDILQHKDKAYILELNPRQGRSCDYLRGAGVSLARFFVEAVSGARMITDLTSRESLWCAVPVRAVLRRIGEENRALLRSLRERGRIYSPFSYEGEKFSIRRALYLPMHAIRRTIALNEGKKYEKG